MKKLFGAGAAAALVIGLLVLIVYWMFFVRDYKVEMHDTKKINESAFLVDLQGDNKDQTKLGFNPSSDNRVLGHRIQLAQRWKSNGTGYANGEWVPAQRLVKVSREPVTVVLTADPFSGTSKAKQALEVQSEGEVKFAVPVTIAAIVEDRLAHLYHRNFNNKSLKEVLETDVRGSLETFLMDKFDDLDVDEGRTKKVEFITAAETAVKAEFLELGVTILYVGGVVGLEYKSESVQERIDAEYLSELDAERLVFERTAAGIRNDTAVLLKQGEKQIADIYQEAGQAIRLLRMIDVARQQLDVDLKAAKKFQKRLPEVVLPSGPSAGDGNNLQIQLKVDTPQGK